MSKLNDSLVFRDITLVNLKRIFYVSLLAVPVSVAHIVIFGMELPSGSGEELSWRIGIMVSHSILAFLMFLLGSMSFFLCKRTKVTFLMKFIVNFAFVVVFIFGVVIVVLDQLVTSSITPFMVACIFIGVVFLIRPIYSVLVYALGFIAFYIALGITQVDQAILLSNRVNGITVAGIGLFLSIVLWKSNMANMVQKILIEEQQTELLEKNKELEHLAFFDQLTGVYNRRKFEEFLNREHALIKRYGHESCIALVDIDSFKEINDNYGHPVGDLVLREVASVLRDGVRETDVVSRWGGDEFMILFPHTSLSDASLVADKLRALVADKNLRISGAKVELTASFGVALLSGDSDGFLEVAYRGADEALYRAKEFGSNRVEVVSA